MTIAACYVSPEGVIFGADSTTNFTTSAASLRHYNYAQKILQVGGQDSTLGLVMWGAGGLNGLSHRTLVAQFAESNCREPTSTLEDVASRLSQLFWRECIARHAPRIDRFRHLVSLPAPTSDEQVERDALRQALVGGFCLGGNLLHDRIPQAFEIAYEPLAAAPAVQRLSDHELYSWGAPNFIRRLFLGIDPQLYGAILQSGRWLGTPADLSALIESYRLGPPGILPLRESKTWYTLSNAAAAVPLSEPV